MKNQEEEKGEEYMGTVDSAPQGPGPSLISQV